MELGQFCVGLYFIFLIIFLWQTEQTVFVSYCNKYFPTLIQTFSNIYKREVGNDMNHMNPSWLQQKCVGLYFYFPLF